MVALVCNVLATALVAWWTQNIFFIALSGPVFEKVGFFPAHIREACIIYRTTEDSKRKSFWHYQKKALKGGLTSLVEDVLVHDPLYVTMMIAGLMVYPGSPEWLLSLSSFILAILLVPFAEIAVHEGAFWKFKRNLQKIGFGSEKYYETRFCIDNGVDPDKFMENMVMEFDLEYDPRPRLYEDLYLDNNVPEFSGRHVSLRLRKRTGITEGFMQTAQIVFTKAQEKIPEIRCQHRYFPILKEKMYFIFNGEMPSSIQDIKEKEVRLVLDRAQKGEGMSKVSFHRTFSRNDNLLVSIDKWEKESSFFIVEVKARKSPLLLMTVMRHIMHGYPVVQTTIRKSDMGSF